MRVEFQAQLARLQEPPNEDVTRAEPDLTSTTNGEQRSRIDKSILAVTDFKRKH